MLVLSGIEGSYVEWRNQRSKKALSLIIFY
jgi:hypothetical protein